MNYSIRTFGVAADILGGKQVSITMTSNTVAALRAHLAEHYPKLKDLNSLFIAVNLQYADDNQVLSESDEIAIIPPVSGG